MSQTETSQREIEIVDMTDPNRVPVEIDGKLVDIFLDGDWSPVLIKVADIVAHTGLSRERLIGLLGEPFASEVVDALDVWHLGYDHDDVVPNEVKRAQEWLWKVGQIAPLKRQERILERRRHESAFAGN